MQYVFEYLVRFVLVICFQGFQSLAELILKRICHQNIDHSNNTEIAKYKIEWNKMDHFSRSVRNNSSLRLRYINHSPGSMREGSPGPTEVAGLH